VSFERGGAAEPAEMYRRATATFVNLGRTAGGNLVGGLMLVTVAREGGDAGRRYTWPTAGL
jgi:hypothetical protein